jgi:hypothetical protein
MLKLGFEPTNPVFEWAKAVHTLDRAATVIGVYIPGSYKFLQVFGNVLFMSHVTRF